jgi:hypothetical protein
MGRQIVVYKEMSPRVLVAQILFTMIFSYTELDVFRIRVF